MAEPSIVGRDKVISIEYTLRDDGGEILDTSDGAEPLVYLHGHGNIVPGLETALEGKLEGHAAKVSVPPEEGYGVSDPELIFTEPRASFDFEPEVGQMLEASDEDGDTYEYAVTAVTPEGVTLDGNHPLAGMTLHFDVKVVGIRDATAEELSHGHVHGHGDHEH